MEEKIIGQIDFMTPKGRVFADVYELDQWETYHYRYVELDEDEELFRYSTPTTLIGKLYPLIKINMRKNLVYFLKQTGLEHDLAWFERKGVKILLNTIQK